MDVNMYDYMSVTISRDKIEASICLTEPELDEVHSEDDIYSFLKQKGIVYGIDASVVESLTLTPIYGENVVVATGVPPVKGEDGRIEHFIEENPEAKPTVNEDGTVDYKNMNVVHSVVKDEKLCEIFVPEPGVEGVNVLGEALAAQPGKVMSAPRGKGIRVTDDGRFVLATIDGQVRRSGNNIEVKPVFEVQKDVDNSTGNIRFVGNVIVRGGVSSGFAIEAGGSVEVFGRVEKANITAVGDIILHSGVGGMGAGMIKSGGRIYAKYVENCILSAHGKITAEAIMNSTVRCGDVVELTGRKGLIVGGSVKASLMIKAVTIGSQFSTPTEIEVGTDPRLRDRLKNIREERQNIEAEEKKTRQTFELLKKRDNAGQLTDDKKIMLNRMEKLNAQYKEKLEQLKNEQDVVETALGKESQGSVKVSNCIFHGVRVVIGSAMMVVKEELAHCTLKREGADVRILSY